jgi:hypothetical protein
MLDFCEDAKLIVCLLDAGKSRRVQFVECPNDINGMIDAAKIADLALLLIDGSYGFEMVCCQFVIFLFSKLLPVYYVSLLSFLANTCRRLQIPPFLSKHTLEDLLM